MNTDLKHGSITDKILRVFYEVYTELGHGFLESVYHRSLVLALETAGLSVSSRVAIPVWFRGHRVGHFEADVLVEDCVLLELKQHAVWIHRTERNFLIIFERRILKWGYY
jgi:GxxExxY protein